MRTRFLLILFSCLTILLADQGVLAADTSENHKITGNTESALIGGIGTGNIPDGHYQPGLLIWHVGLDLKKYYPGLARHRGSLSVFLEPQVNLARNPDYNFEFGIGIGIQYRYPLTENFS